MANDVGTRHAFWMRSRRGWRSSWLHLPAPRTRHAGGVVICSPLGHEYTHSYRALLHLADRLSEAGIPALRFDYHACGSSAGDSLDADLVETWKEDVSAAVELMARVTGGPTSVVGLRLGATLAALASPRFDMEHFVAWAPVLSGRRYLREQKALAKLDRASGAIEDGGFHAGGLFLTEETASGIGSSVIAEIGCRVSGEALVLEPVDLANGRGLAERLRRDGIKTEVVETTGYAAMMEKPHLSVLPRQTIASIVDWLSARATLLGTPTRRLPLQTSVVGFPPEARVVEELVHVPGSPRLFGVLTTPSTTGSQLECPRNPLLLLTNAGSAHNVGPNRLYVEMSRRLAAAGFPSLRLDLSNLGDSARGHDDDENHPYPPTAVADMARAIEWLSRERGFERVVVGGLCSGAYHAFRCGVELPDDAIVGLLLINPLTFRWEQGATISDEAAPHARLSDAKKWRKLLRGDYEMWRLVRFAGSALRARAVAKTLAALDRLGMVRPRPLDLEILNCISAGRRLDFVYSTHDPGHGLLRASTGATVTRLARSGALSISLVPGADHSFSRRAWREELIGLAEQHMSRYLGSATAPDAAQDRAEPAGWRRAIPSAARTALEWVALVTAAPI